MNKLQDWVLELGFDSSKIEQGLKKVDRLMEKSNRLEQKRLSLQRTRLALIGKELALANKLSQVRSRVSPTPAPISRGVVGSPIRGKQDKVVAPAAKQQGVSKSSATNKDKEEIALLRARNSLRNKITKAESLGLQPVTAANKLSSSNVDNIKKTIALLERRISIRERELSVQKRQAAETRKIEADRRRAAAAIPAGQRAPTAVQRNTAVTRARDGAIKAADLIQVAPVSDAANQLRSIKKELLTIEKSAGLAKTRDEIDQLKIKTADLNKQTGRLATSQKTASRAMIRSQFAAKGLRDSLSNLARSYISIFAIIGTGAALLRTAKDFARIRAVMLLSSDTAQEAKVNFQFVQDTASKLGADISATADAFAGFNVSARSANVSADESKKIFTQLATAIQATGLDANRSGLAFLAFKQMLAGPVIQAQEMNQVVEQLPQFTDVAIRALKELGIEGDNFREIIARGTVNSRDFITVVARMLEEQARTTGAAEASQNNLIAAQNRMNNTLKNLADIMATSGLNTAITDIFTLIGDMVRIITPGLKAAAAAFGILTKAITAPLKLLFTFTDFIGATNKILLILAARFLWIRFTSTAATGGVLDFLRASLQGTKSALLFSKAMLTLRGAIVAVSISLRGLFRLGPLLILTFGFELIEWLVNVVKATDAWKETTKGVAKAIQGTIREVSILIAQFKKLIAITGLYARAAGFGFTAEDAGRVIRNSEEAGRSSGLREVARRKEAERIQNSKTEVTNNNELTFNVDGGDPAELKRVVLELNQEMFAGAS